MRNIRGTSKQPDEFVDKDESDSNGITYAVFFVCQHMLGTMVRSCFQMETVICQILPE